MTCRLELSLPEQFARRASEVPDRTAVIGPSGTVSYRRLGALVDELRDGLARHFLDRAVVAVLLPSDVAYIATVLAVAGGRGVFAPVDEAWPDERIISALTLAAPSALVVAPHQEDRARRLLATLPGPCTLITVAFDATTTSLRATVSAPPETADEARRASSSGDGSDWRADSLYLVYTSGSTGTPNAVEGLHRSLAHFIEWQTRTFGVDHGCRVSQLAPTTFDVSLRDIFLPLTTGGVVVIPSLATKHHPVALAQWFAHHRVSLLHTIPSLFRVVALAVRTVPKLRSSFDSLQKNFFSGERLYAADAAMFHVQLPADAQVFNFYGPSEGTLIKTYHPVPRHGDAMEGDVVPLGRAIDDCVVRVDATSYDAPDQTPDQMVGEIVLESPFLSRGYLRNPGLTAAKFSDVGDPERPGWRSYRTGDLGFFDPQGLLHFTGRRDHQIKLNGNRIELSDIEHCARRLSGIDQVVVVASAATREEAPSLTCAYVSTSGVLEEQLRAHLRACLPSYMVPGLVTRIEAMPLMLNGKTDRKKVAALFETAEGAAGSPPT